MSSSFLNIYRNRAKKQDKQKLNTIEMIKKKNKLKSENLYKESNILKNEAPIINFICNSKKNDTILTNFSDIQEMKYDLTMLKKYEENLNSSLSFISDFDLEKEEDSSFNSSFESNPVEEIKIIGKIKNLKIK